MIDWIEKNNNDKALLTVSDSLFIDLKKKRLPGYSFSPGINLAYSKLLVK